MSESSAAVSLAELIFLADRQRNNGDIFLGVELDIRYATNHHACTAYRCPAQSADCRSARTE